MNVRGNPSSTDIDTRAIVCTRLSNRQKWCRLLRCFDW